jgi:hypothetical protein
MPKRHLARYGALLENNFLLNRTRRREKNQFTRKTQKAREKQFQFISTHTHALELYLSKRIKFPLNLQTSEREKEEGKR